MFNYKSCDRQTYLIWCRNQDQTECLNTIQELVSKNIITRTKIDISLTKYISQTQIQTTFYKDKLYLNLRGKLNHLNLM